MRKRQRSKEMEEDSREDASVSNPNDSGWAESVDPAYNRVVYYASLRGALPQPAPKRARSSSAEEEDGRAARGAGRGRGGEAARRPPPPNFFFAVRIDDEDVVDNAKTLQQHLMDEEARLWPTTYATTNPSTQSNDGAQKDEDQDRVATSTTASSGAGDNSKRGLGRYMIDVRNKLHVTLFVVCAPTPDLVARTQALCTAWAADLRSRPAADISSFEMKVESVRCFNKGRGQFVLWAGIQDPAPLERLARDLHSWFVQHEPSLLQSIKWTPFTPHATLLKVRSFGRGQGGSGGHGSSPGARVLRILRPPQPVVEPTTTPQQRPEQEQDCVEGEVIIYQGRPHQDNDSSASNDSNDNNASKANASGGERANRGRGRGRGGWQGGTGRGGGGRKRSDHEVLDEGRRFGRQVVESIELLAMQGCEAVDERGRGGYPVYGRIFLNSSRSEYLDRAWAPPQLRAARGEEVVVADEEEKEEEPAV